MSKIRTDRGAVSIFIVVFTALLVTVVTASFIQIMVRDQEQATNNDLAQSAYDSALAGVEDAKRALIAQKKCERAGSPCADQIKDAMDGRCNEALKNANIAFTSSNAEEIVGTDQNQAYTCVAIQYKTSDVEGSLSTSMVPDVVGLDSGDKAFTAIRLSWFSRADLTDPLTGAVQNPTYNGAVSPPNLPGDLSDWPATQPPLLRAQLIQFDKNVKIDVTKFNKPGTRNALTTFLYPIPAIDPAQPQLTIANVDDRRDSLLKNSPQSVACKSSFDDTDEYLCSVDLKIPMPDGVTNEKDRQAYLQLMSYYSGATHYKIELIDASGEVVEFMGEQPIVDSTGRASDLFRRVRARISLTDGAQSAFPDVALYVRDNLCKDFFVTDDKNDYNSYASEGRTNTTEACTAQ